MNTITLCIRLNDKDTKVQNFSIITVYKIVQNIVSNHTGKCTIFEADWIDEHKDNTVTIEKALKAELFDVSEDTALEIIKELKISLNLEAILMQHKKTIVSKG